MLDASMMQWQRASVAPEAFLAARGLVQSTRE